MRPRPIRAAIWSGGPVFHRHGVSAEGIRDGDRGGRVSEFVAFAPESGVKGDEFSDDALGFLLEEFELVLAIGLEVDAPATRAELAGGEEDDCAGCAGGIDAALEGFVAEVGAAAERVFGWCGHRKVLRGWNLR